MSAYLTPRELAERWSCHPSHVRSLCVSGELRAMRLGVKSWRISEAAVAEYEYAHSAPEIGGPEPAQTQQEVRAPVTVDGFTLPADYEPCFPDLWPLHETKKAASQRHREAANTTALPGRGGCHP